MPRVLITGGSRGIGQSAAGEFARYGWSVAVTSRSGGDGAAPLDVADDASIRRLAAWAGETGGFDALVLNAGAIVWKDFGEHSFEDIELLVRTNVEGSIKIALALLPHVCSRIVVVGSDLSKRPHSGLVVYSATKAAIRAFALALAGAGIGPSVVCVNPDRTATAMNGFEGRDPAEAGAAIYRAVTDPRFDNGAEIDIGA